LTVTESETLREMTRLYYDRAVAHAQIDPGIRDQLRECARNITVSFPVKMDDGTVRHFTGYRVQHNTIRGPAKGGVRFAPYVTLEDTQALAMLMTWKTAAMGIPFGGAKGAVMVNPAHLSSRELQGVTRRYTGEISILLGPERDIPDTDVGTDEQTMAWMLDAFAQVKGYSVPAVVTGKPVLVGGTAGMNRSTGRGVVFVLREAAERMGLVLEDARVAVQGFGKVGVTVSALLSHVFGARVVAVSDSGVTLYDENGLDVHDIVTHKKETGSLRGFGATELASDALLTLPCDILVPSALENVLHEGNAHAVQAKLIVEGANAPTTPAADAIFQARGIIVIPDIIASAGSVTVSYFEWVQGLQSLFWEEEEVTAQLKRIMLRAFDKMYCLADEQGLSMRTAAYVLAIERVAKAYALRGIYP
jgi:glutamate dehydrogenase (NAD(P)+)